MKTNRLIIGGLVLAVTTAISSCSTTRQIAHTDDVYNNRRANTVPEVYQSPDYYYDEQEVARNNADNGYYADDYEDDEFGELEYANRINRFHYASSGMTYFDPFFDPWMGYGGFGLGWSNWGWNAGWSMGFGWGNPYAGWYSAWNRPYYGYGWGGFGNYNMGYWGPNSYYNVWGHPYYGYGYGGGGFAVTRPANRNVASGRSLYRDGFNTRVATSSRRSTDTRVSTRAVSRDANGRIVTGTRAARRDEGTTTSRVGTNVRTSDRGAVSSTRSGSTVNNGSRTATSRTGERVATDRSSTTNRPARQATSPEANRPSSSNRASSGSSATPSSRSSNSGSSYTPSRSSGSSMSSGGGSSRSSGSSSSGGSSRSSRR